MANTLFDPLVFDNLSKFLAKIVKMSVREYVKPLKVNIAPIQIFGPLLAFYLS